ncbi:btb/poz domain-containing [Anaeramoeba flamelloides]|uniref:Btb/poz domain-containing n=1 Tax=Anaeramoeba flamelloides TaxID=1746091 RepID=A0AAV8ACT8_9EUKA|nr:btb/poz domain-containing [Anaeramoeba flamelloides]
MQITPLINFYKPLINRAEMADIQFVVGKQGRKVWAHKLVCSVSSTLFKTMFYSRVSWSENINLTDCQSGERVVQQIEIPDIEYEVFLVLLEFMYTREAHLTEGIVWKVFHSAEKFNLPELQALCMRYVLQNLTADNCLVSLDKCRRLIISRFRHSKGVVSNRNTECQPNRGKSVRKNQQAKTKIQTENFGEKDQKLNRCTSKSHTEGSGIKQCRFQRDQGQDLCCTYNPKDCACECCRSLLVKRILRFVKEHSNEIFSKAHCLDAIGSSTCKLLVNTDLLLPSKIMLFRRISERGSALCKSRKMQCCPKNVRWAIGDLLNSLEIDQIANDHLQELWDSRLFGLKALFPVLLKHSRAIYQSKISSPYLGSSSFLKKKKYESKQDLKILLLTADQKRSWRDDVSKSIKDFGILYVDILKAHKKTPSYETIKGYDVIVVYSWSKFDSQHKVGDMLARFVEDGGGLVISTYYSLVEDNLANIDGRIVNDHFLPISTSTEIRNQPAQLGDVLRPNHPIMNGVKKFDGGEKSLRISTKSVENGGVIIAKWSDGTILAASKQRNCSYGRVVVLNFCFVSDNVYSDGDFWNPNTDGATLIGNSISYAGKILSVN